MAFNGAVLCMDKCSKTLNHAFATKAGRSIPKNGGSASTAKTMTHPVRYKSPLD